MPLVYDVAYTIIPGLIPSRNATKSKDNYSLNREIQDNELLDMRKLKALSEKLLPPSSLLRKVILSEPDYVPRSECLVKLPLFAKMLDFELKFPR